MKSVQTKQIWVSDVWTAKAISGDCTCPVKLDTHLNSDLLWSAVLARQSIMVLLLSEEVPGCSCVSLAKRGCLEAIMSTSTRLLRLPDWRRTWQGQKSQLKTLEGCVWLLCGHKATADFYPLRSTDWIDSKKKGGNSTNESPTFPLSLLFCFACEDVSENLFLFESHFFNYLTFYTWKKSITSDLQLLCLT